MEPDDPALLRNLLSVALKAKNRELRERVSSKLFEHPKLDSLLRASILTELGDDAWRAGQLDLARKRYEEASALAVDPQTHRNAVARTEALATSQRAAVLKPLLVEASSDVGQLFRMREHLRTYPDDALTKYLLGRQLVQRDGQEQGISLLESALNDELPDPEFSKETLRMLARAYAEEHQCADVKDVRQRMEGIGATAADVQLAADWLARCEFETSRGWSPL
jgi:tetratricopeptide (TPR) repeat protein